VEDGWDWPTEIGVWVEEVIVDVNANYHLPLLRGVIFNGSMEVADGIVLMCTSVLVKRTAARRNLKLLGANGVNGSSNEDSGGVADCSGNGMTIIA